MGSGQCRNGKIIFGHENLARHLYRGITYVKEEKYPFRIMQRRSM